MENKKTERLNKGIEVYKDAKKVKENKATMRAQSEENNKNVKKEARLKEALDVARLTKITMKYTKLLEEVKADAKLISSLTEQQAKGICYVACEKLSIEDMMFVKENIKLTNLDKKVLEKSIEVYNNRENKLTKVCPAVESIKMKNKNVK